MGVQEEYRVTIERLRQIKRVLEGVPDELFDMGDWTSRTLLDAETCGTTHCVGGWLRLDPWWIENTEVTQVFAVDESFPDVVWPAWETMPTHGNSPLVDGLALLARVEESEAAVLFGLSGRDGMGWEGYPDEFEGYGSKQGMILYIEELVRRRTLVLEGGR